MRLSSAAGWWRVDLSAVKLAAAAALAIGILFSWGLAEQRWMLLGAAVLIALSPILLRWPIVAFGVYAFLLPFDVVGVEGTAVTKPIGIVAGLALISAGLVQRRLRRPPLAALCWAVFMMWAVLTMLWSINPEATMRRLPTALSVFFLYSIAVSFKPTRKELEAVCALLVCGAIMAAGFALIYGRQDAEGRGTLVIDGSAANPNSLGAALVLPFAIALAAFVASKRWTHKAVALGSVAVITVGIYSSISRGALLAMLVAMAVIVVRTGISKEIVGSVGLLVALAMTRPDVFFQRIVDLFTGVDATGSGRTAIWQIGIAALERFGIAGAGLETFVSVYSRSAPHGPSGYGFGSHNSYLMVWVELGIIGLFFMLAALTATLWAARKAWRLRREGGLLAGIEAGAAGVLVSAFFADIIWYKDVWFTWILLAWATIDRVVATPDSALQKPEDIDADIKPVAQMATMDIGTEKQRGPRHR